MGRDSRAFVAATPAGGVCDQTTTIVPPSKLSFIQSRHPSTLTRHLSCAPILKSKPAFHLRINKMKFPTSIVALALAVSVQAECYITGGFGTVGDKGCCWGGDQGADACLRQQGGIACTQVGNAESANFCINMGIPTEKCDGLADFECDRARIAAISRLAMDSLAPRERTGVTANLAARTVIEMETFSE
ncbi:hypothetical protein IG631_23245 [Alternaria alternata]|nr:hypothetical protein IG631_23245 [Alternaria alternata]